LVGLGSEFRIIGASRFLEFFDHLLQSCGFGGGFYRLSTKSVGLCFGMASAVCNVCGPTAVAVPAGGQEKEEVFKLLQHEGLSLSDLDVGEIVVPDFLGGLAFGEKQKIGLDASARSRKNAARQTHNTGDVAII
jgi:hypothetical protein